MHRGVTRYVLASLVAALAIFCVGLGLEVPARAAADLPGPRIVPGDACRVDSGLTLTVGEPVVVELELARVMDRCAGEELYVEHTLLGRAGMAVEMDVRSRSWDVYLEVADVHGAPIAGVDPVTDCTDCGEGVGEVFSAAALIFPYTGEYRLGVRVPVTWAHTGGSGGSYTVTVRAGEGGEIGRLVAALRDPDPLVRRNAAQSLDEMGSDAAPALPALILALDDRDPGVVYYASWALANFGSASAPAVPRLTRLLAHPEELTQQGAAAALGGIGPKAAAAVDALMGVGARPGEGQILALWALGEIGPAAAGVVPDLIELLGDPDPEVRFYGARALWAIGPPAAAPAAPAAAALLLDEDADVRIAARTVLASLGPDGAAAAPRLIEYMSAPDPELRAVSAWILGHIGAAPGVVPALRGALADPEADVRREAAAALGAIGSGALSALSDLVRASTEDGSVAVRWAASEALELIDADWVWREDDDLIRSLQDPNPRARIRAAELIGELLGTEAPPEAFVALAHALTDEEPRVRTAAFRVIIESGPAAAPAVPVLIDQLRTSGDRQVRWGAVVAMGFVGPVQAHATVPVLVEVLENDGDAELRLQAVESLQRIGPDAGAAVPALARAMKTDDSEAVRTAARAAIDRLDPDWFRSRASMVETLRGGDTSAALRTVFALREMGPPAAPATEALTALLTHPDRTVRAAAATTLGAIGPRAAQAVPLLIDLAADPQEWARGNALFALSRMGPAVAPAVPVLLEALPDPSLFNQERGWVADGLVAAGPAAAARADVLARLAVSSEPNVQAAAFSVLERLGPAAEGAVPVLMEALDDGDPRVRAAVERALAAIGDAGGDAGRLPVYPMSPPERCVVEAQEPLNNGVTVSARLNSRRVPAECESFWIVYDLPGSPGDRIVAEASSADFELYIYVEDAWSELDTVTYTEELVSGRWVSRAEGVLPLVAQHLGGEIFMIAVQFPLGADAPAIGTFSVRLDIGSAPSLEERPGPAGVTMD